MNPSGRSIVPSILLKKDKMRIWPNLISAATLMAATWSVVRAHLTLQVKLSNPCKVLLGHLHWFSRKRTLIRCHFFENFGKNGCQGITALGRACVLWCYFWMMQDNSGHPPQPINWQAPRHQDGTTGSRIIRADIWQQVFDLYLLWSFLNEPLWHEEKWVRFLWIFINFTW